VAAPGGIEPLSALCHHQARFFAVEAARHDTLPEAANDPTLEASGCSETLSPQMTNAPPLRHGIRRFTADGAVAFIILLSLWAFFVIE